MSCGALGRRSGGTAHRQSHRHRSPGGRSSPSPMTTWTDRRLSRLFERYRVRYWPTSRRLASYHIKAASLEYVLGRCDLSNGALLINLPAHRSDREVRSTVLLTMIHAVNGRAGHHAPFWKELEGLLSKQAPITADSPELGEHDIHLKVIPRRFIRCRRLFRSAYERKQRAVAKMKLHRGFGTEGERRR